MIIKNINIFLLILIISFPLMIRSEENINFQINCKVLDNVVIEMSDGKSNRYSGYENGVEIGSQIFIKFGRKIIISISRPSFL